MFTLNTLQLFSLMCDVEIMNAQLKLENIPTNHLSNCNSV